MTHRWTTLRLRLLYAFIEGIEIFTVGFTITMILGVVYLIASR